MVASGIPGRCPEFGRRRDGPWRCTRGKCSEPFSASLQLSCLAFPAKPQLSGAHVTITSFSTSPPPALSRYGPAMPEAKPCSATHLRGAVQRLEQGGSCWCCAGHRVRAHPRWRVTAGTPEGADVVEACPDEGECRGLVQGKVLVTHQPVHQKRQIRLPAALAGLDERAIGVAVQRHASLHHILQHHPCVPNVECLRVCVDHGVECMRKP
mmetsp:Transcript_34098/g.88493  ORF Transcript_34098/g.88493 Transcript_34098/m.88493 type:complete len:210 (-) Transcript_34098:1204-1833(-)